mgnify:CR=1 FL=1
MPGKKANKKTTGVQVDEFGTPIPKGFKSSTGKDYQITSTSGTLESTISPSGAKSGMGSNYNFSQNTMGSKTTDAKGVTSQTMYKPTKTTQNFDKSVNKKTDYTTTSYQAVDYNAIGFKNKTIDKLNKA